MATTVGTLLIDMAANVTRLVTDMAKARAEIASATGQMQSMANKASTAISAMGAGFSVVAVVASTQQISKALMDAEASAVKFKAAFTSISGADSVGREMEFVRGTARSLGLDLEQVSSSYIKLSAASRGTSLQGEQTREIFTAVSKAATTLGLSASETDGALLAISQMMSKGTVSAEELRGQLGERLPGAFQIAARSMGVSTSELGKMMEAGQVIAEDFLPKFAKQITKELGQASADAAHTAAREMQRLSNEFGEFQKAVADSGAANAIGSVLGRYASAFANIAEQIRIAKAQGAGFFGQMRAAIDAPFGGTAQQRLDSATKDFNNASGPLAALDRMDAQSRINRANAEIAALRQAAAGTSGDGRAGAQSDPRVIAMQAEIKAVDALSAKYTAFSQSLSGQHKDYQSNLAMLQAAREKGIISETEYVAQVKKLVIEQGGVKDAIAARTKAETEAEKQAQKLNDAYFDALGISKDYSTKVRELETLQKTGRITTEQYAAAIKNLAADQQVSKDAVKAQKDETDKLKQAEKERMAVLSHNVEY